MTISLSKNMLGAILKLVADIDGVDLKLNETNSFIELNTKVTDKNPYLLKLSVGIDPLVLGIALGGLKIGLAANGDVLKNCKHDNASERRCSNRDALRVYK